MDILPDNKADNIQLCILDPLSVIIKLAILSNKHPNRDHPILVHPEMP